MLKLKYLDREVFVQDDKEMIKHFQEVVTKLHPSDVLHISEQKVEDKKWQLQHLWEVTRKGFKKAALCPCGSTEPAGYHNYGPTEGWPHCPDCGYV